MPSGGKSSARSQMPKVERVGGQRAKYQAAHFPQGPSFYRPLQMGGLAGSPASTSLASALELGVSPSLA